jgi:hypothetical protein
MTKRKSNYTLLTESVTGDKECEAQCRSDLAHVEIRRDIWDAGKIDGRSNVDGEGQRQV